MLHATFNSYVCLLATLYHVTIGMQLMLFVIMFCTVLQCTLQCTPAITIATGSILSVWLHLITLCSLVLQRIYPVFFNVFLTVIIVLAV